MDLIVGTGDGLKAQYFNGTSSSYGLQAQPLPSPGYGYGLQSVSNNSLALSRVDSTIDFNWNSGSPDARVNSDKFSAEWTGQILAPETGSYIFTTKSDDGIAVWVNGQQLINDWNNHATRQDSGKIILQAGQKYDIKVDYFENSGGAVAQLFWTTPTQAQKIIPQSYLYSSVTPAPPVLPTTPAPAPASTAPTGDGLKGQYFNSVNLDASSLALTRIDSTLNFAWNNGSPDTKVNSDQFSAIWTGQILAPETGSYTFSTKSDDGIRLWVNGQQLINAWNDHGTQQDNGTITLKAGQKYDIKVDYYERSGGAVAQLFWKTPTQAQTIIPQSSLYSSIPATVPAGSSTSSPIVPLNPAFTDSTLPNEAAPSGVPSYYDWANGPTGGYGNNIPTGWNAFTAWGQLYVQQGWNPPANSNTRVQITNLDSWYLSKSTGKWIQIQHAATVQGAAFVENFANNASKSADIKDESKNGGGISVTAGDGYNFHFWTDRALIVDPNDIGGIYTRFQARLVLNDASALDDRSSARYLASDGADYWKSMDAGWSADWSTNGGVGGGRFKFVTNEWQNFSMETLTPEQLLKNPPPA